MLGTRLETAPFWNYFLVVSCEEIAVDVNPFSSSYHLLFIFVNCLDLDRSLFAERRCCFFVFSLNKCLVLLSP